LAVSAPGRARRRVTEWLGGHWVYAFLAVLVYIPPMFVRRGVVSADNKVYLYLDPGRMLSDAAYLWDPNTFMGTVPHQGVGYLFPVAPYYWLTNALGIPVWISQRFWLSTVVFFAGAGVVYLLRTMRWRGPGVLVAALAYMFTPYFLNYASAFTVIALPWTGLPWMIAFVMLSVRHRGWRYPALFALTIQCIGSVNASSLAFSLFAAMLWLPFAVWITHEVRLRQALTTLWRLGLLTLLTSLWWMSGLWAQSRYGIDVLRYSETARTVATASTATEVLRGLGYWYFYGTDKLTPIVDAAQWYTGALWLVALSFLVPTLSLLSGAFVRFRERAYFVALIFFGMVMAVGAYPWTDPAPVGGLIKWFLTSSQAGSAMRSLPRAAPLVVLGLATLLGGAVTAVHERLRLAGIPRPVRFVKGLDRRVFAASGLLVILIVANQPSLMTGWFITNGISRPSAIPDYWQKDAAALNSGDHNSRIWEIPGSNFASYRWDGKLVSSVDPITPGLTSRPFVAREQVPYGTLPTANLLAAFDDRLQQNVLAPSAIAPIARFMSVGDLNVRSDLAWERYGTVRPNEVWNILSQAGGLGLPQVFGGRAPQETGKRFPMLDEATLGMGKVPDVPKLAIVPVDDSPNIVKTAPATAPVLLDGDGSGLVDTSAAGLLSGRELVLYSASMADDPSLLRQQQGKDAVLVLTDSNRKRGTRWGTIQDMYGETELAGEKPLVEDPSDQRIDIFDDAGGDDARTVAVQRGGVTAVATSYGNPVTFTPDVRAMYAVDGSPGVGANEKTSWATAAFGPTHGERLELTYAKPLTTGQIILLQPKGGHPNRWITKVQLKLDNGFTQTLTLNKTSRKGHGQIFTFPTQTFSKATLTIVGDSVGKQYSYGSASSVGFANVSFGDGTPMVEEYIQLPSDLLTALGRSSLKNPLALVLTRDRINKYNSLRTDPEPTIARTWVLPNARSFGIYGTARLAPGATPKVIDEVLGMPDAAHGGVDTTESRHLTGAPDQRATSAIDGDPTTWWTTGFLSSLGNYAQYKTAKPVTIDHLDLAVVADGRHSIPTKLDVKVDDTTVRVAVPKVAITKKVGSVTTVRVPLPEKMTGSTIRFTIRGQKKVLTRDWYSNNLIPFPISIAEWGVPGIGAKVPSSTTVLSSKCRDNIVVVNGKPVPVTISGTVGEALDGHALTMRTCGSAAAKPPTLPAGRQNLLTAQGGTTGFNVDQLVLRSAAGGAADVTTGPLVPAAKTVGPKVAVTKKERTKIDLTVTGADRDFWLVLGQSQSKGWQATVDGRKVGGSTLVDGYANGWQLGPSTSGTVHVTLTWTPQRVVWISIGLSVLAVLVCLVMVLLPMRRRRMAPLAEEGARPRSGPAMASVPLAFEWERALRYNGAAPKLGTALVVSVGALLAGGAIVGYWAAPIVGIATLLCMRFRRARPILTLGAPAALALAGLYYLTFLLMRHTYLRFGWPSWFTRVAPLGWFAVIFLALDVIVDRTWLRRWWPSAESEL
jgi:arabinofuranan 3-O-arabinosyltransferase